MMTLIELDVTSVLAHFCAGAVVFYALFALGGDARISVLAASMAGVMWEGYQAASGSGMVQGTDVLWTAFGAVWLDTRMKRPPTVTVTMETGDPNEAVGSDLRGGSGDLATDTPENPATRI